MKFEIEFSLGANNSVLICTCWWAPCLILCRSASCLWPVRAQTQDLCQHKFSNRASWIVTIDWSNGEIGGWTTPLGFLPSSFKLIHKSFCNVLCHETGRPAAQPSMGGCARSVAMFLLSVTCHSKIQVRFHNSVFNGAAQRETGKRLWIHGWSGSSPPLHLNFLSKQTWVVHRVWEKKGCFSEM